LHDHGVTHRYLTPGGIITLDDGRLVLRDLGLAARDHEPGEGPADYQAPEQRRGDRHPGPQTDIYQLAAVAYHLVTGRPPNAGISLPVRAQARDVPERVRRALDAALALDPTERPDISSLGATLRAARDDLS
jgi:serine/threonine protein kinase